MDKIRYRKTNRPKLRLLFAICTLIFLGCSTTTGNSDRSANMSGKEKWCREFYGITVFYRPLEVDTYRRLLPGVFNMPADPLVQVYVFHFSKMASWFKPYHETAVFLLAEYQGRTVWHCITMPVTTDQARVGGIRLGYPKVLGDITLDRTASEFRGTLKAQAQTILELTLNTEGHEIMPDEKEWFDKLKRIGSLNILNGRVFDPLPAMRSARYSLYDLSQMNPALFTVEVGRAKLAQHPKATPRERDWRPSAFAVEPKEIVLAYYFKNRVGFDW